MLRGVKKHLEAGMPLHRALMVSVRYHLGPLKWRSKIWVFRRRLGLSLLDDLIRDRRFGGWAGGTVHTEVHTGSVNYFSSTHHWELNRIFTEEYGLAIGPDDVLVDFGCGRGRVINHWLSLGLGNKIYGLELDDQLARQAQERLKPYPNVVVLSGNGLEHLPSDGTVFWSFNPFEWDGPGEAMMRDFSSQLRELGRENIRVVLFRTPLISVFAEDPYWHVVRYQGREGRNGRPGRGERASGMLYSFGVARPAAAERAGDGV